MTRLIECEGAPRDLGLDQGTQCRDLLNASYLSRSRWQRAWQRALAGSAENRRVRLELRRFYPRQAEMLQAIARAARVPSSWLASALVGIPQASQLSDRLLVAADSAATDCGGLLARTLPVDAIVRRSRPESGFRSIALTQPWRVEPLAGVNEAGLAVASVGSAGRGTGSQQRVPAALLAHDCLARFERLEPAIDWLFARPAGGVSMTLLADASGEVAGVSTNGNERRVFRPAAGFIVHTSAYARQTEIDKGLREASPLVGSDLARFLGMPLVAVEPQRRRIGLLGAGAAREADPWFEV